MRIGLVMYWPGGTLSLGAAGAWRRWNPREMNVIANPLCGYESHSSLGGRVRASTSSETHALSGARCSP
jgi:hypothetical protein